MIAALVEVANERGAGQVTVTDIVAHSGVSRRTFYELFADREDCLLAGFDLAVQHAARRVIPAYRAARGWRERVRAGLGALLEFLEEEPDLGVLCVVDALAAGQLVLERREQVVRSLIEAVDEGRGEARVGARPTRLTAEGVVGAVLAVLHARLAAARGGVLAPASKEPMLSLLGPLMAIVVLPYQGQAAAGRELAKPNPRRRNVGRSQGDPLRTLDMRLTYRTVRVLVAIASNPGASNRQIADAAGVVDQGQISKLLARLEHLGLICNRGMGSTRGEPNAWSLTPRGEEIERTIREQTTPAEG
jgi:AcrR family transcriptional regulator/DNA-binding MarR family transcriptional regulator